MQGSGVGPFNGYIYIYMPQISLSVDSATSKSPILQ